MTIAALAPLALPDLPEAIGRRLVEEHLLDPERFWLPVPPPSVSAADPSFSVKDTGRLRACGATGAGPTWINTAWLVWLGLVRLGYAEPADAAGRARRRRRGRQGLREYYHPFTGAGMGARRLRLVDASSWSCSSPTPTRAAATWTNRWRRSSADGVPAAGRAR